MDGWMAAQLDHISPRVLYVFYLYGVRMLFSRSGERGEGNWSWWGTTDHDVDSGLRLEPDGFKGRHGRTGGRVIW